MDQRPHRERLGQLLLDAGLVTHDQLEEALARQRAGGGRLGSCLVELGIVSEAMLLQFLSRHYGVAVADLSRIDKTVLPLIPPGTARRKLVLPLRRTGLQLALAVVDPSDVALLDELQFQTGLHIVPHVALESRIRDVLEQHEVVSVHTQPAGESRLTAQPHEARLAKGHEDDGDRDGPRGDQQVGLKPVQVRLREVMTLLERDNQAVHSRDALEDKAAPVVQLVWELLRQAVTMEASDIHLEPFDSGLRVRFRVDGVLQTIVHLPQHLQATILARIKIMANLDIAERRLPQDGRMKAGVEGLDGVDIRVSILPCLYGEKAVLRLLTSTRFHPDLRRLGFEPHDLATVSAALEQPQGMILVTGPTGSGKTTTLYSALQYLNTPQVNIVTVEDPVEYRMQGITQLQVKEDIGLTFAVGLRAFLRQDPDIMMVGEIRDRVTADIAVQSALTGHRVLSTLHTGDAPRAMTRLLDMGVEPFLVASSLSMIIAQRLVRKICEVCREPDSISVEELHASGVPAGMAESINPWRGCGCMHCHGTGFKGRVAIFEVLPMSDALHDHVLRRASAKELRACACAAGMTTLRQSGWKKVANGLTTVGEIVAATMAM